MEEQGITSKKTKIATIVLILATIVFTAMIYGLFIGLIRGNIAQGEIASARMLIVSIIPIFLLHMGIYVKIGMKIWEEWRFENDN
jgi:hypothetical protein